MRAAVAAGHPATVAAGAEVLAAGGSAADAAVAASLASCVAETVMTGLLGGGHAIHYEAASGRARDLDCFVAVPGLGAGPGPHAQLVELQVPFGTELVHYAVGVASCGVPGLPAGLGALHAEHGRLPWPRLVEPALRLAHDGVELPPAHAACLAMLEPVMTMREGPRLYAPGDWLPGLDLHLNSMLGEADLIRGELAPGERMGSMMSPALALDADGLAFAGGAAGGTRLRSALAQVLAGTLDEGLGPQEAVDRPRLHPAAGLVHVEPGLGDEVTAALEDDGWA